MSFKLAKHLIPLPLDKTTHNSTDTCWFGYPNASMPVEFKLWLVLL